MKESCAILGELGYFTRKPGRRLREHFRCGMLKLLAGNEFIAPIDLDQARADGIGLGRNEPYKFCS
ncbi:hypothetical protein D3C75_1317630 [compost metagenome]